MNKLLSLLLAFLLLCPISSWAAITLNDTSTGNDNVTSSLSWTHTVSSGTTVVAVCIVWSNPGTTMTDITDNSVSFLGNQLWAVGQGGVVKAAGFLILNPSTGAHTINAVMSASVSIGGGAFGVAGAEASSLAAAHRTVYTQAAAAAPSITVTDSQSGDFVWDCTANFSTATLTHGSGQTAQWNLDSFGGSSTRSGGFSTEGATGGNTLMDWTGAAGATGGGATSLVPASGGGPTLPAGSLMLMGVGR